MNKTRAYTFIGVALVIGFGAGWFDAKYSAGRVPTDIAHSTLAAEIGGEVRALERLRAGNTTNAVEILEAQLDGALLALEANLSITPNRGADPFPFQMLQLAKDYRAKFPHQSNSPEMAQGVARAFQLADEHKRP